MQNDYLEIKHCRICRNQDLVSILDLGNLALTGIFPKSKDQKVLSAPLELVKCQEGSDANRGCGLVQLRHSLPPSAMYGEHYGYRSGLNPSMVTHLRGRVAKALRWVKLAQGDLILDIGSNDGTLLRAYLENQLPELSLLGIDPTANKFRKYYPEKVHVVPDFFSVERVREAYGVKRAKIVTSLAMFYDLDEPIEFMRQVREVMQTDGIWVFEQSYLPQMLRQNSYDTICHEHLEYYALKQIKWMTDRAGLKILDVEFNDVNGGSFAVTVARDDSQFKENSTLLASIQKQEADDKIDTIAPYEAFRGRIFDSREKLLKLIHEINHRGQKVLGYGASTKGNVILQFCKLTEQHIPAIMEVNPDKYGAFAPGSLIPIISEEQGKATNPDYILPLPWHFKKFFLEKEKKYIEGGGKILFPLPEVMVVGG